MIIVIWQLLRCTKPVYEEGAEGICIDRDDKSEGIDFRLYSVLVLLKRLAPALLPLNP